MQHGRSNVLRKFWAERQELEIPDTTRVKSVRTLGEENGQKTGGEHDSQRLEALAQVLKKGGGAIETLDGVINGLTLEPVREDINLPLVLITSEHDALDSSTTARVSRRTCRLVGPLSFMERMNNVNQVRLHQNSMSLNTPRA